MRTAPGIVGLSVDAPPSSLGYVQGLIFSTGPALEMSVPKVCRSLSPGCIALVLAEPRYFLPEGVDVLLEGDVLQ